MLGLKRQKKVWVNTAKFGVVESFEELKSLAEEIGYPVMVKAVDSSGSRGISQALSFEELSDAYQSALTVTKSNHVIVEKFLDGYEIGAQAIVIDDEVVEVFLHNDEVTPPPICVPVGHTIPVEIDEFLVRKTKHLIQLAVKALGIQNTIANIDIMIVNNEPYILEVGARMGATCLAENISIYAEFDAYEFIVRLALGEKPRLPSAYKKQANAAALIRSDKSGLLKSIVIPDETMNHPCLKELSLDVKVGDKINKFKTGPDRIGQLVVAADSASEANELVKKLASTIQIEIQ